MTLSIKKAVDASDLEAFLEIVRSYSLTADVVTDSGHSGGSNPQP